MAENKDFNIVSSAESVKTIDKAPKIDPPVKAPKLRAQEYDVLPGGSKVANVLRPDTNYHVGIDISKYSNKYNKGAVVLGPGGVEALNEDRANQQGWFEQARNMVGQAVVGEIIGGTIEGLGYLGEVGKAVDYINGTEQDWGNWMTELGKDTREFAQENMAIHQKADSGMGDSAWWFSNGVSVASSLSMLMPSGAAVKALGMLGKTASKGLGMVKKSLDIASKMGKYEKWMAEGITQAVVSRHIENSMEASGAFTEQKKTLQSRINPKTGAYFTEEEATSLASTAASSTYKSNWAMLLQDIPQYLALGKVFNPITMKMESNVAGVVAKGVKPGFKSAATQALGTFASEGAEESYQYYIAEKGKLLSDLKAGLITESEYDKKTSEKIGDKEMLTSAFWGGLGGNIFQAAGKGTSELFKSSDRKEYEKNYATIQGDYIAKRGISFQKMQKEIAIADQSGDPAKRQAAIDGAGIHMAIEAIDNDKFDQHIESLNGMAKMSPEERAGFEKQMGIELDPDLFKQYVPSLIEQANSIRSNYLKHLNKNEKSVASKMAMNDHYIKSFDNRVQEVGKEIQALKDSVPNASKLTTHYQDKFSTKGNITALKRANSIHESAVKNTESQFQIKNREALIEKNNKLIEKLALRMEELNSNDPRTKDEKDSDKLIGAGYEVLVDELITKAAEKNLLTDSINLMQKETIKLQDKEYQKELIQTRVSNTIKKIPDIDSAMQAKANIDDNQSMSSEEKKKNHELVDKRIDEIKIEEKNKTAKAKQEENTAKLKNEAKGKAKENPVAVPDSNIIPVGKNLEDEFATEEVDISTEMTNKSDKAKKTILASQLNIGTPHVMQNTAQGKNYTEWMLNGKDKVGSEVRVAATNGHYPNGIPAHVQQAIDSFVKGVIDANVIDFLPLTAQFGGSKEDKDSDKKIAFLGAKVETKTAEHAALWEKDREVRKAIIEHLLANNNEFKTTVAAQMGGKVNAAPADGGIIPENNIGDFKHLGPVLDEMFDLKGEQASPEQIVQALEPNLMYTNEFGELMTLDGERHPDYIGKQMTLPLLTGSTGSRVPMKGTIFLSVPKADGHKFPLKLNVKKHTEQEATIIADLLTSVITKENTFETPLSKMEDKYKFKIQEHMQAELNAMENEDPSLMEIIDFFTYVSSQTEGKASELFISGEWVKFGSGDLKVTPQALFNHSKLVDFLMNTKRRQFNVGLWETSPEYRAYAISSGLINTDAVVDGPLFGGNTNIYIKAPIDTKSNPLPNPANILQHSPVPGVEPLSKRRKMTTDGGVIYDKSTGKFAAMYYNNKGGTIEIQRDDKDMVLIVINTMYNNEKVKGPATVETVKTQPLPESKKKAQQDDMSNLPAQETGDISVVIKKDAKSNFNLIVKDGGIVVNTSTGKELDSKKDAKLINKALLKSGLLKYEKITIGKQVYAATSMNTIINITPGSPSNGNEILTTSAVGVKVMAQYTGKFTGKVDDIGSEDINKINGEELVKEMINGKSITDFTVEEQRAIDTVSLDRKKEIQAEITTKRKAAIKAIGDAHAIATRGKSPAREMSDEEVDQIYKEFMGMSGLDSEKVNKFIQASEVVILNGAGSSSAIQRGLKLGYNQAGRYIDMLESMGIVGPFEGAKARVLLLNDKVEVAKRIRDSIGFAIEIYQSKNTFQEEFTLEDIFGKDDSTESSKINDPKMLLMGINSLDLLNEKAIEQEQADVSSLEVINNSADMFDNMLDVEESGPDFSQVDNSEVAINTYVEDDGLDFLLNFSEDESGCKL